MDWQLIIPVTATFGLILACFLFWRLSGSQKQEYRSTGSLSSVPIYSDAVPSINTELNRARRFHHRLCIVVFRLSNGYATAREAITDNDARLRFLMMGEFLREELREFDIVTFDAAQDRFIVVLVETTSKQGQLLVNRLSGSIREQLEIEVVTGIAEFPYSGLILEDLVCRATEECILTEPRVLVLSRKVAFN